jgi:5-methylcytosine-specific restriction endonuclease McrA
MLRAHHGYSKEDSVELATFLVNPNTTCGICRVPLYWLQSQNRKGRMWNSLQVDHIIAGGPSTMENTRILCQPCNTHRGDEKHTDEEVLLMTRRFFEARNFTSKELWWLPTSSS